MTSSPTRPALRSALVTLVLFIVIDTASALPRLSLISGTRCSACHFTPHGGGIRTELGWDALNQGAWRYPWQEPEPGEAGESDEDLFNSSGETVPGGESFETQEPLPAHDPTEVDDVPADEAPADESGASSADDMPVEYPTNSFFDGLITPGVDVRLQLAKIGRPPTDRRMLLPMQTQVNLAITPVDWLAVYGGVNASTVKYSFAGQSSWEATAQIHPGVTLPILRIGYMQPSIGIRHDDHTMFTRRQVAGQIAKPLIPPGYAELGAEVTYEGTSWLSVNAGVFSSRNLSVIEPSLGEMTSIADFSKPSVLGRVMLWPQLLDLGYNGEIGASVFANGDFRMINAFAGFGIADRGSILVEGLLADFPDEHTVRNVSIIGTYQLAEWLSLDWRYEWGQTELIGEEGETTGLSHAHQAVFGLEFFPLPYVEVRPEYRLFQNEPFGGTGGYVQGQYTLQLHLFY